MQPIDSRFTPSPQGSAPTAAVPPQRPAVTGTRADVAQPDEQQVRQAIESANAALKEISSDLEFAQDGATGKTVVRVIDAATHQVIRQFPSEEMLAIARTLDRLQGVLIRQKA